jgi:hypothetical protein
MQYLYALPCPNCPHGEMYIMATEAEWPEKRVQAILRHPELFDEVTVEETRLAFASRQKSPLEQSGE